MTTVKRSGTEFSFPLAVELPATGPLPKVLLHAPVKMTVKLKRTDPKSDVGKFILEEFDTLLKKSIDVRMKPRKAALLQLWQVSAKAMAGARTPKDAQKIAKQADAKAKAEIAGLVEMLETGTIHAALTQARKKAEKKFSKSLANEESVTTRGMKQFSRQSAEVGEALWGATENVVGLAADLTNPVGWVKIAITAVKGKADIVDKLVDLQRKVSKKRADKLERVHDRFKKSREMFEQVANELEELKAIKNQMGAALSATTGRYEKLDRQITGMKNLDLTKKHAALYKKLQDDGSAAEKVMDTIAGTLTQRDALQRRVNDAIKAVDAVMKALEDEVKVANAGDAAADKLKAVQTRHKAALAELSKAA